MRLRFVSFRMIRHFRPLRLAQLGLLLALLLAAFPGCSSYLKRKQLEAVAKDWSMVVRASQVIPVYPLTEDLQPGDLFLVLTPIPEQADEYSRRGFLPLDQHLARLPDLDYGEFYDDSYGVAEHESTPRDWQFPPRVRTPGGEPASTSPPPTVDEPAGPSTATSAPASGGTSDAGATNAASAAAVAETTADELSSEHTADTDWHLAPRAAFPSYNFSVASGGALGLALPIQGVPVALSLMQTDTASGSVTIADAYTYGVPFEMIADKVEEWAGRLGNLDMLKGLRETVIASESTCSRIARWFKDEPEPTIYLRVVSRVYLTGRVVAQVNSASAGGAAAKGGVSPDVELPAPDVVTAASRENREPEASGDGEVPTAIPQSSKTLLSHAEKLEDLSDQLSGALPGGKIRLAWATNRSVSLSETFERPLVIGYLGFDFPVLEDGSLGSPVATRDQFERRKIRSVKANFDYYPDLRERCAALPVEKRYPIFDAAAEYIGGDFQQEYSAAKSEGRNSEAAFGEARRKYLFGKSPIGKYIDDVDRGLNAALPPEPK